MFADEKIYNLCKKETTRALRAVQNRNFITVAFSASTLGVRIGSLSYNLAEAIVALTNDEPLSSLDFTEVTITKDGNEGSQAVGGSGARAYTRLPVFNGIDLEEFCPGKSSVYLTYEPPITANTETITETETETELPAWGIGLIAVSAVGVVLISGFVFHMIKMEKKGKPVFSEAKEEIA